MINFFGFGIDNRQSDVVYDVNVAIVVFDDIGFVDPFDLNTVLLVVFLSSSPASERRAAG